MKPALSSLLLALALNLVGCAAFAPPAVAPSGVIGAGWRGKTVALSERPRADFLAMTAGKSAIVFVGIVAMVREGNEIAKADGLEDTAAHLGADLLRAAQARYGVVPAPMPPVKVDTQDVGRLADAAAGADLLFDVESLGAQFRYLPLNWGHYVVESSFKFRLVDVRARALLDSRFCVLSEPAERYAPTKDQLLANHGALLKTMLESQRKTCLAEFERAVLRIR